MVALRFSKKGAEMTAAEARALIATDPAGVQVQSKDHGVVRMQNVGGPAGAEIAMCRGADGKPLKIPVADLTEI